MRFRVIAALLILVLSVAVIGGGIVYGEGLADNSEETIISFWGDSIAEGVLGASPINERETNCYYAIVGRTNGFTYYNRAVSGHKTANMLEFIQRPDEGAEMNDTVLRTSDIIHISILGNDLLQNNLSGLVTNYAAGERGRLDELLDIARENFADIIEYIRSVNPEAVILMSTVYNPMYIGSSILSDGAIEYLREVMGMSDDDMRALTDSLLLELNGIVYDYLEENPGAYHITDVAEAFNDIYKVDRDRNADLFYNDGVHPSNEGHAVIAGVIQRKLEELGLSNANKAFKNYKKLRAEETDRLYSATGKAYEIKNAIKNSDTIEEVTETYFDLTDGLQADYLRHNEPDPRDRHLDEDTRFAVTDECAVWDIPLMTFLDAEKSHITLYADGRIVLEAYIAEWAATAANLALAGGGLGLEDIDIQSMIADPYASELFPGFDLKDPMGILDMLDGTLGLGLIGIDPEHPGIAALIESLETTGRLPASFSLPNDIGIRYEGTYYIEELTSSVTGETYTAVYTGLAGEGGQPYIIGTLTENEDGTTSIKAKIEFLNFVAAGRTEA